MPADFLLRPQYSGVLDVPGGSGNRITYESPENHARPLTIWAVEYIVNVFPTDQAAAGFYDQDTTAPAIAGWAAPLTYTDRPVPGATESDLYVGIDSQFVPLQMGAISYARFGDIVLTTTVIGTASDDMQASTDAFGRSLWYFVDLAVQKITQ